MLTLLFCIGMLWVFGKMIGYAFKATWGLAKVFFTIILLPLVLIFLVIGGLIYIALPLLIMIGIVMLVAKAAS